MTKWTGHLRRVITHAADVARQSGAPAITPEHIIIGLLSEKGAIGRELLLQSIKKKHLSRVRKTNAPEAQNAILLSPETERLLLTAAGNARRREHHYVGTEHLLEALLTLCAPILHAHGMHARTVERLGRDLAVIMKSAEHFSDMVPAHPEKRGRTTTKTRGRGKHHSALDMFCRDLVKAAEEGAIDPVIGREEEIGRVMTILARRTKNNPMLLGESGVGKTAIVEGLALRIAKGTAPAPLLGKRILSLDVGAIVAGTVWRGAFEERMKKIVDELRDATDTVLFIDEVHTILGAGSASGSLDAANFLKPALARGSVRCIGATTVQDYKKTIETDGALERRFQPIIVLEPTPEKTIAILEGLRPLYEQHHGVAIAPDALSAAVALAKRYFPTAMLPDKAIDLLDEAAAGMALAMPLDIRQETIRKAAQTLAMIEEKKGHALDAGS
ncbi:ATP-dependent Clp protease ATP-binding subunit, partial [Candidatus Uhrbacteria bacterium]|nr:ATP-dependent Clp protease ATP-binding subunit [Candidatus Uhrbacteria bacterium]